MKKISYLTVVLITSLYAGMGHGSTNSLGIDSQRPSSESDQEEGIVVVEGRGLKAEDAVNEALEGFIGNTDYVQFAPWNIKRFCYREPRRAGQWSCTYIASTKLKMVGATEYQTCEMQHHIECQRSILTYEDCILRECGDSNHQQWP